MCFNLCNVNWIWIRIFFSPKCIQSFNHQRNMRPTPVCCRLDGSLLYSSTCTHQWGMLPWWFVVPLSYYPIISSKCFPTPLKQTLCAAGNSLTQFSLFFIGLTGDLYKITLTQNIYLYILLEPEKASVCLYTTVSEQDESSKLAVGSSNTD